MHLIDTNVAIHLRDRDAAIIRKYAALSGPTAISVVTRVELEGGVAAVPHMALIRRRRLDEMLGQLRSLDFGEEAAVAYRRIVEAAGFSRRKVLDRMIAAQALVHGATLVTCNGEDFRDVPGLRLVEW